jgi:hypothetical protein
MVKESLNATATNAGIGGLLGAGIGGGIGYFGADDDENAWARAGRGAGIGGLVGAGIGGGATELGRWHGPRQEAARLTSNAGSSGLTDEALGMLRGKLVDEFRKLPHNEQLSMLKMPFSSRGEENSYFQPDDLQGRIGGNSLGNLLAGPGRALGGEPAAMKTPLDPQAQRAFAEMMREAARRSGSKLPQALEDQYDALP